mmetsp:Transcript_240/g.510  ORF Transcript_240/g.510 Transcript_240/m.510 type:complete len:309 (-) Transcript_240:902-1828(-)
MDLVAHFEGVVCEGLGDRHDHHLARGEEEGPLARVVLDQNGDHSLHRAQHSPMHHHRPLELVAAPLRVSALVLEVEPHRLHKVQLHRGALEGALQRVEDLHVNLRPIEGAVARVECPSLPRLRLELIERLGHQRLGPVPHLHVAQRVLRPRRELERKLHPEEAVHSGDHVQHPCHLLLDLCHSAEDVRVVLLKPPHAREARERAGQLVAVKHAEVGIPHRQLSVRALPRLEHDAMARAVHRLQPELLRLDVEAEHVLLVLGGVAGGLPQLEVVHVGRDHLRVAALPVLLADDLHQLVVQPAAVRQEEA